MPAVSLILPVLLGFLAISTPIPHQEDDSPYRGGAFLEEDREIAKWVSKALEYKEAGQWSKSVEIFQRVIEEGEDAVVSSDGRLYQSVRAHCHKLIASSLEEGPDLVAAYRLATDVQARRLFEEASAQRNPEALMKMASRYFCSTVGDDALEMAGDLFLDRRDYARALRTWMRLFRIKAIPGRDNPNESAPRAGNEDGTDLVLDHLYPSDSDVDPIYVLAKMAFSASRLGRDEAAETYVRFIIKLTGEKPLLIGGEKISPEALRDRLLMGEDRTSSGNPKEWPTLGGNAAHNKTPPSIRERITAKPRWSLPLTRREVLTPSNNRPTYIQYEGFKRIPPTTIVISNGIVVTRAPEKLTAVDLWSGKRKWYDDVERGGDAARSLTGQANPTDDGYSAYGRSAMTIAYGRVYIVEGPPPPMPNPNNWMGFRPQNLPTGESVMAAYHLEDGSVAWKKEGEGFYFAAPPTAWEGRLYVPVEKQGQLLVVAMDPQNGEFLWQTFICGSPGNQRVQAFTPVTVDGGLVYVLSSSGAVAAVDAVDGALEWVVRYKRSAKNGMGAMMRVQGGRVRLRNRGGRQWVGVAGLSLTDATRLWIPTPPVARNGRVIVSPCDSEHLLCLDGRTGDLLWRREKEKRCSYLLGVTSDRVVVGGNWIYAYDLSTGKLKWLSDLREEYHGRGVASEKFVYVPLKSKVIRIELGGGKREVDYDLVHLNAAGNREDPGEIGNLILVEGTLLAADTDFIHAFTIDEPVGSPRGRPVGAPRGRPFEKAPAIEEKREKEEKPSEEESKVEEEKSDAPLDKERF
ncbi:MAG: PQQ-binding-like beta-propeller repeat protein [Planctomycetota bacterium]|nr:PQQ-binding-like beta-propeller repeat protein [Planctomycetota bacterium]